MFVPLSDLTIDFLGGDAQVRCSGWWDADSDPLTGLGGDGERIRTNETGARIEVEVSDTTRFIPIFGKDHYSSRNQDHEEWKPRPGWWRHIRTVDSVEDAPVYGERPSREPSGWQISTALDGSKVYRFALEPTHPVDHLNEKSNGTFIALEYMREPPIAPNGEHGAFHDLIGFVVDEGAVFNTVTDPEERLQVLLIGDSNMHGYVEVESGQATVEYSAPGYPYTSNPLDARGHAITWARQLGEAVAADLGRRACFVNLAYGQLWNGTLDEATREAILAQQPGAASDPIDRFDKFTGYTNETAPFVAAGRPLHSGYTPDLIIFGFVTNNQLYSATGAAELNGTRYRDDTVLELQAIHAAWPNAWVLAVNNHIADAVFLGLTDAHARFAEACGVGYLDHAATDWLAYADIRSLISTGVIPNLAIHLNGTQHTAVKTALLSTALDLVRGNLNFSLPANSQYVGVL